MIEEERCKIRQQVKPNPCCCRESLWQLFIFSQANTTYYGKRKKKESIHTATNDNCARHMEPDTRQKNPAYIRNRCNRHNSTQ